jgi:sulfide dehydrogenase cytochrome subunit
MRTFLLIAATAVAAAPAFAQDAVTRSLAATCANCHGTDGRSVTTQVPALAGVPRQNIVSALKGFKDGTRPATVMHQLAKGYTDAQIDALAGYFSSQKP